MIIKGTGALNAPGELVGKNLSNFQGWKKETVKMKKIRQRFSFSFLFCTYQSIQWFYYCCFAFVLGTLSAASVLSAYLTS